LRTLKSLSTSKPQSGADNAEAKQPTPDIDSPLSVPAHDSTGYQLGDVFLGVGDSKVQWRKPDGSLVKVLDAVVGGNAQNNTTGMAFDAAGNLYMTSFGAGTVVKFDRHGRRLGIFGSGYDSQPESIVFDKEGFVYVGQANKIKRRDGGTILKFSPSGELVGRIRPAPKPDTFAASDWIDLAADGRTLFYTQEAQQVRRLDSWSGSQLHDFAGNLKAPYALRVRPNGTVLLADVTAVYLFDSDGRRVRTYAIKHPAQLFALNLDPDGTSFWTATTGGASEVYRVDISSGDVIAQFGTGTAQGIGGLAVFGEITAARPTVAPQPSPKKAPEQSLIP
jgi:sugar lactone lactonase YvrE